jgi:ribosomal protein L29
MDYSELKKKSISELNKTIAEMRDKLRDLRFKDANKQLKDVREIREIRKIISRILTLINKQKNNNTTAPSQNKNEKTKDKLD